jgi:hypothetical protein
VSFLRFSQSVQLITGPLEFDVAKKFLTNSSVRKLNAKSIEELCLAASREFYDNASSGNLHVADMKLAYDWYV